MKKKKKIIKKICKKSVKNQQKKFQVTYPSPSSASHEMAREWQISHLRCHELIEKKHKLTKKFVCFAPKQTKLSLIAKKTSNVDKQTKKGF